ncbi:MAG: formylglycine-generating enzyme family protein [Lentisphaeraceae bacterium]|nr:formylglycine-generating enzyme family protein [Lentisphaeraceae bacterium]
MHYFLNILISLVFVSAVSAQKKNSLDMDMVQIKAGEFEMGTLSTRDLRDVHFPRCNDHETLSAEGPQFKVKITKSFFMSATEVTVAQFRAFVKATNYKTEAEKSKMGMVVFNPTKHDKKHWAKNTWKTFFEEDKTKNWQSPGIPQTDSHPVVGVSWNDTKSFCKWLSEKEGKKYRLPTEAEWEYTARAGTKTFYAFGDKIRKTIHTKANVANSELEKKYPDMVMRQWLLDVKQDPADKHLFTAPVASYPANAWGLYDMHGNVWEWCEDYYQQFFYKQFKKKIATDPLSKTKQSDVAELRVVRGGSWFNQPMLARSAARGFYDAPMAAAYLGFRVVCEDK